jgi:hypothetical protein
MEFIRNKSVDDKKKNTKKSSESEDRTKNVDPTESIKKDIGDFLNLCNLISSNTTSSILVLERIIDKSRNEESLRSVLLILGLKKLASFISGFRAELLKKTRILEARLKMVQENRPSVFYDSPELPYTLRNLE